MGYIKKLKSNELVGGTDKTTIYPVTSTEAVFEEVSENNFQSQEYLNNHIYGGEGGRINEESITDYNIAKGTITKGKLSPQVQTMLDEGQKKALTPKGNYNPETEYEALDLVFDSVTNSSYVSLVTPNTYPVNEDDEGYEEGKWQKVMDGSYVNTAIAEIQTVIGEQLSQATTAVNEMKDDVDAAIEQANQDIRDLISESEDTLEEATSAANNAAQEATDAADTVERLTSLQVADAQIGYFECTDTTASGAAANETKITTTATIGTSTYTKVVGSHVKIKMAAANTHAAPVYLQFGSNTATRAPLLYNGEAVSASNTWEEGEVISVYFDGTNYQASNAQGGGGGKFKSGENVKDVSITDEVIVDDDNLVTSGGVFNASSIGADNEAVDLTEYTPVQAFPNSNNKWIVNSSSTQYFGIFIPIIPNKKYLIAANGNVDTYYCFLKNNTYSNNTKVQYASGCTRVTVAANEQSVSRAPNDAKYLYVSTTTTGDSTPQKVEKCNKELLKDVITSMLPDLYLLDYMTEIEENGFAICGENLNIIVKVDENGIHAPNILDYVQL